MITTILFSPVKQAISLSLFGQQPPRLASEPHWPPVGTGLLWQSSILQAMCKGSLLPMCCHNDCEFFGVFEFCM